MVSDGVLLYLGYLYLVLGPHPASVLLVEEPETGIHVGLLKSVMKIIRDMTTGAHGGPPTQVILTTHSPLLLNLVEPDEIRVVKRDDEGATQVFRFSEAPNLGELLDYQGPGGGVGEPRRRLPCSPERTAIMTLHLELWVEGLTDASTHARWKDVGSRRRCRK